MKSLLECIPNFSEGRRNEVIESIASAASSIEGVRLLDLHQDPDHNRMVLTLVGESAPLQEAVYRAMVVATNSVDLRDHTGEHPRIGATDVVPFVPLGDTPMQTAIAAAVALAHRVSADLRIPVYLYEEAATRPERRNLERIRRGGFEELRDSIHSDPSRSPDLGASETHPTAGAVAIGARGPLIAYNIYLHSEDVNVARSVARRVRHSNGGLRFVKALGLRIPARHQVQVSMNLTNFHQTPLHTVFNLVQSEAAAYGVAVAESEIVGLIPVDALLESAGHYLRLHAFTSDQVLEILLNRPE